MDSKVYLIVHGNVQGVGYRHFVSRIAKRLGINGLVRNEEDGSVSIVASGTEPQVAQFVEEINVDYLEGPSVANIERYDPSSDRFPDSERSKEFSEFAIVD